jgi:hypothetical protein
MSPKEVFSARLVPDADGYYFTMISVPIGDRHEYSTGFCKSFSAEGK